MKKPIETKYYLRVKSLIDEYIEKEGAGAIYLHVFAHRLLEAHYKQTWKAGTQAAIYIYLINRIFLGTGTQNESLRIAGLSWAYKRRTASFTKTQRQLLREILNGTVIKTAFQFVQENQAVAVKEAGLSYFEQAKALLDGEELDLDKMELR